MFKEEFLAQVSPEAPTLKSFWGARTAIAIIYRHICVFAYVYIHILFDK